jgi:hypothetical protein
VDTSDLEGTIPEQPKHLTMDDELWFHGLIDHKLQESMRAVNWDIQL